MTTKDLSNKDRMKGAMKAGLGNLTGAPPRRDSPFESTTENLAATVSNPPAKLAVSPAPLVVENTAPASSLGQSDEKPKMTKADLFQEKVLVNMSEQQKDIIDDFAKMVMKATRGQRTERITANTVVRCLIDMLDGFDGDVSGIKNEDDLRQFFQNKFKS